MSHHRRARHVFGVAVCIAVMVATTGCRRSPFHRHGEDRPTRPDGKPIGYQEPQSPLDQASAKKPSAPKPAATPAPIAVATTAVKPMPSPPPIDSRLIAPAETPMLDAALKRAEAIEAEQRRIMLAAMKPTPKPKPEVKPEPEAKPAAAPAVARPSEPDAGSKRDEAVQLARFEAAGVDKTKLWQTAAELVEMLPSDLSAASVPATLPKAVALFAPATPGPEPAPFAINAVQLCRAIHGFGSFETMDSQKLRAGRPVLVYCEPAGLRYDQRDDEYVSHVATRVELIAADGSKVWEVDGDAEDHCRRLRHDSFVGTQINIPKNVPPGSYSIRLTQTDVLAQRSATAEIDVTIGP